MREASETIFLIGNPNVGKSVIFWHLTGVYATVSNYPGTTVGLSHGRLGLDGTTYDYARFIFLFFILLVSGL